MPNSTREIIIEETSAQSDDAERIAEVDRIAQIEEEIAMLEERLANVKGTECEVYTRIVGYHRAIENWNKGKKEEYKDRVTFKSNPAQLKKRLEIVENVENVEAIAL